MTLSSKKEPRTPEDGAFGQQIRAAMEKRKISISKLARDLGCSVQAIRNYQLGLFCPRADKQEQMERILGVRFIKGQSDIVEPHYDEERPSAEASTVPLIEDKNQAGGPAGIIRQAQKDLAARLGVDVSDVRITVEFR